MNTLSFLNQNKKITYDLNTDYIINQNNDFSILSPLSQFEIRDLLSIDAPIFGNLHISITNIGFYLTIGAIFLIIISLLGTNYNKLVSNN
jgi:F-type H+-transporting ATPase subunit a